MKNSEIFQKLRRNFDQDNIRKMTSMEIPSKKEKDKARNRRKDRDKKYYDL